MNRLIFFSFLTFLCSAFAHAGQTGFYYKSEPGDPIGNGQEAFYTDTQQTISVGPMFGPSTWLNTVAAQIYWVGEYTGGEIHSSTTGTMFEFSAPNGMELVEGTYPYPPARWDLSQSCSGISGSFTVKEAVYDYENYALVRFAVDFVEQCPGSTGAYYGYLRYNSDIPFPEGLPPSIASDRPLNKVGCFEATGPEGANVLLHVVNGASSYSYEWSAVVQEPLPYSGGGLCIGLICSPSLGGIYPPVATRTATGIGETFALNLSLKEKAAVTLTTTDALTGEVRKAFTRPCVSDTTPPEISIQSPRNGETYVGNNLFLDIKVTDIVDPNPIYRVTVDGNIVTLDPNKSTHVELIKPEAAFGPVPTEIKVWARDSFYNNATETVTVYAQHDMRK